MRNPEFQARCEGIVKEFTERLEREGETYIAEWMEKNLCPHMRDEVGTPTMRIKVTIEPVIYWAKDDEPADPTS